MTETETEGEAQQTPPRRKSLVFLEALLAATPDELGRMNTAIRAARELAGPTLPSGADEVIAAAIADPEIARMLEQLEAKRIKARFTGFRGAKGQSRDQIRATAQQKREAEEARRQERERQRQQREAQREAEKRERAEARTRERERQRREREEAKRRDREQREQPQPEQITAAAISTPPRNKKAIKRRAAAMRRFKKKYTYTHKHT